jgi:hypothetical protein
LFIVVFTIILIPPPPPPPPPIPFVFFPPFANLFSPESLFSSWWVLGNFRAKSFVGFLLNLFLLHLGGFWRISEHSPFEPFFGAELYQYDMSVAVLATHSWFVLSASWFSFQVLLLSMRSSVSVSLFCGLFSKVPPYQAHWGACSLFF